MFPSPVLRNGGSNAPSPSRSRALFALLACLVCTGPALAHAVNDATGDGTAPQLRADAVLMQLAQAQSSPSSPPPARPAPPSPPPASSTAAQAASPDEPVGNVATLTGTASVMRKQNTLPLKLKDDIYLDDVVVTFADSTVGITFNDETTFNLTANASITIDNFLYEDGGKKNAALFDVTKGTVAFVASAVAKTGDMKIATPTATLGIRGTTGLVEVNGAGSGAHNIKLYPDPDGRVGHIDVSDRNGVRLGSLTEASSGFTLRAGAGGRITAAPLIISAQQAARDQGIVRQLHAAQAVGRRVVTEQRALRRANPNRVNPNAPRNLQGPPGERRQNNLQQRPGGPPQPEQPHRATGQGRPQQPPAAPPKRPPPPKKPPKEKKR